MTARLRIATPDDAPAIAAIYAPAVAGIASFEVVAPDAAEMARRVTTVLARTPWLVCERDGVVVGYAYASAHRERAAYQWSVDVSAYVADSCRRAGVGRALYTSLLAILALQGFRNAYAGITLPNDASVGLHRALGFTPVGVYRRVGYKAGAWHDVLWLERALAEHVIDPPPPRPFPEIREHADVAAALALGAPLLRLGAATP